MTVAPPTTDRLRGAFLRLVRAVWPQLLYFATYEAQVVASSAPAGTQSQLGGLTWVVSCTFTDPAVAAILPPLANITMWPGPVWGYSQPAPGALVRVSFVNGDPSKPAIVGLDPTTLPVAVTIGSPTGVFLGTAAAVAAIGTFASAVKTAGTPPPTNITQAIAMLNAITAAADTLNTALGQPTAITAITKAA